MTGRIRLVKPDREMWVQRSEDGFVVTCIDDLDRTMALHMTNQEAGSVGNYLLDNVSFRDAAPENVADLILNDAEAEIRRIFKDRMNQEQGWSDALSDVLTVVRDMFTDLTDRGDGQ